MPSWTPGGDESGYELTTWGGTVGMDVDINDRFTAGAAFTANYRYGAHGKHFP